MQYPKHLQKLIETLKLFPGVGAKSAERFAFQMLEWNTERLRGFAHLIENIPSELKNCGKCGCLMEKTGCQFCKEERLASKILCVIASAKDAYAIESTREYRGGYHVLGALLSPLEGKGPEHLRVSSLIERIKLSEIKEVILALDSTLEGDATSLYLKKELESLSLKISRLAFGIPMGSSFEYVDGGTLARALSGRGVFNP